MVAEILFQVCFFITKSIQFMGTEYLIYVHKEGGDVSVNG